jgi:hypothetical protein
MLQPDTIKTKILNESQERHKNRTMRKEENTKAPGGHSSSICTAYQREKRGRKSSEEKR